MKITIELDESGATPRVSTGSGGSAPAGSSGGGSSDGGLTASPAQFDTAPASGPGVSGSARNGGPAPSAPSGGANSSAPSPFMMAGSGDLQGAIASADQAAGAAPGAAQMVETFTAQQEPQEEGGGGGNA